MKDLVGKTITYRDGEKEIECKVVEVKAGAILLDLSSPVGSPRTKATYRAKLKPTSGAKPFWTAPIAT